MSDLLKKRGAEPNPDYLALQKKIKGVQDLIAVKSTEITDVSKGGDAGRAVIESLREADAHRAAKKAERAEAKKQQSEAFAKLYDTPEKAADFCVQDLIARGVIKTAERLGVGEVQGQKARAMLSSGQWATVPYGVGVVAPGAELPTGGPQRSYDQKLWMVTSQ